MKLNRTPMIVALAAIVTTLMVGMSALAQRPGGGGPPGGGGGFGGGRGGGMRMYEQLGLKPDQKTKIEGITKKYREQMQALRKKQTDEIKAVLTPEQRKKLDKQMEEMRQRFGGMMGGPGGGGRPGGGSPPGGGRS
jgi:Spy/CpxP family protein refolding chaperone